MLRFLLCLFGLHGATEIDFNASQDDVLGYSQVALIVTTPRTI